MIMRVMTIYSAVVRIETVNTNSGLRTVPGILWASTKCDDIIYCGPQPSVMILYTVGSQPSVIMRDDVPGCVCPWLTCLSQVETRSRSILGTTIRM